MNAVLFQPFGLSRKGIRNYQAAYNAIDGAISANKQTMIESDA